MINTDWENKWRSTHSLHSNQEAVFSTKYITWDDLAGKDGDPIGKGLAVKGNKEAVITEGEIESSLRCGPWCRNPWKQANFSRNGKGAEAASDVEKRITRRRWTSSRDSLEKGKSRLERSLRVLVISTRTQRRRRRRGKSLAVIDGFWAQQELSYQFQFVWTWLQVMSTRF